MSVPDRKAIREALQALFVAHGAWQAGYPSQPKTFGGQSPVFTLHNSNADWEHLAAGWAPQRFGYAFVLTNFVRRGPSDDADTAEETLDTLLAAAFTVVAANRSSALWTELDVIPPTEPDYFEVDGVQYRVEQIAILATIRQ